MNVAFDHTASAEEAVRFLADHPHVYLLGHRADGYPTGYAMMSRAHDGVVDFSTYRASAKVRNLEREGVAAILAVSKDDDRALWASGDVSVHDGALWNAERPRVGSDATFRPDVPQGIIDKVADRHETGKRCVLRVTVREARFVDRPA